MNIQNRSYKDPRHIPSLDGLRGLAILLVISQHYFRSFSGFSFGWSGVDLFFVLSGYLITGRLLDLLGKPGYFSGFYRNRILRIFPLYYGALLFLSACILVFENAKNLPALYFYTLHWKSFFIFSDNWAFMLYGFPKAFYLGHFWSLAIEEQFYLLWPAIIFFLADSRGRLKLFLILPFLALLIRNWIFFYHPGQATGIGYYFNTLCRIDSFVIGALLCEIHRSRIGIPEWLINLLFLLSAAAIGASIFVLKNADAFNPFFGTGGYTILAIFYACLLHKAVRSSHPAFRLFFNAALLRFFGKISYGLYIVHLPILLFFYTRLFPWGILRLSGHPDLVRVGSALVCLLISFTVSTLSFYYFESFFLRLKRR